MFLAWLLVGTLNAQTPARVDGNSAYFTVGMITFQNISVCSGTLIKQGVFITAKHCFSDYPFSDRFLANWEINFPHISATNPAPDFVPGGKLKRIVFDGPKSDIAYVLYDPKTTAALTLEQTGLATSPPARGAPAQLVGYPEQEGARFGAPRIISTGCQFTGVASVLPVADDGIHYDGFVYGTDCGAYWGSSGGPVFLRDQNSDQFTILAGVVTHTFALLQNGSVDPSKIKSDAFGKYAGEINISPLVQAARLNEMLALDLSTIANAEEQIRPPLNCGYDSFSNATAAAAAAIQSMQTHFRPTFWMTHGAVAELRNMTAQNQALLTARPKESLAQPWATQVFADFDKFRTLASLKPFQRTQVAQLGITNDLSLCDALECTNYDDFTIQINADETSDLFQRVGDAEARHDLIGVFAHQYGHFILDNYYLSSHLYRTFAEAHAKEDPLKYHFTVDLIGMLLSGNSRAAYAQLLREAGATQVMGENRLAGDVPDRLRCFEELPESVVSDQSQDRSSLH